MRLQAEQESSRGQSLVEFALILPLILLLVVNVVNFGALIYAWINLSNAARSAAQYMVLAGASVNGPRPASFTAIENVVTDDLSRLPGWSTVVVKVCTNNNGSFGQTSTSTSACACAQNKTSGWAAVACPASVPANTDSKSDPEAGLYVLASVDLSYTYSPLIRLWDFPKLGIHSTLPSTTIHRATFMRMIQ